MRCSAAANFCIRLSSRAGRRLTETQAQDQTPPCGKCSRSWWPPSQPGFAAPCRIRQPRLRNLRISRLSHLGQKRLFSLSSRPSATRGFAMILLALLVLAVLVFDTSKIYFWTSHYLFPFRFTHLRHSHLTARLFSGLSGCACILNPVPPQTSQAGVGACSICSSAILRASRNCAGDGMNSL